MLRLEGQPFSPSALPTHNLVQSVKAENLGRRVYEDFVALVAKARNLSLDEVDKVARGRVWTGAQAKELALVDALGGLKAAHVLAGELAGLEGEALPPLVEYPKAKSSIEKVVLHSSAPLHSRHGFCALTCYHQILVALSGGESEGLSQEPPKASILSLQHFLSLIAQSDVSTACGLRTRVVLTAVSRPGSRAKKDSTLEWGGDDAL
eukprot:746103-Hanusia_phi.AAC.3